MDARNNPVKIYVGTNDTGATASDPTGGGAAGNNMVLVTENKYDDGNDGDDGNLTKLIEHVDANTTRETNFIFDWRNRQTVTDGELELYEKVTYDNLDRKIRVDRHDTNAQGNLISRRETKFDDRGRAYQKLRYAVDVSTGTVGNALVDNTWHDGVGNVIKSQPAGSKKFLKWMFDGANREVKQYAGYDVDESSYIEATNVDGDTIVEQIESTYDDADNLILETVRQRFHNATGTGELNGPDTVQPKARVSYVAHWHDALRRTIATADYGTNSGSALTRPDTVPPRSDNVLIVSSTFDSAGQPDTRTNPMGVATCLKHDALGQQTELILGCITDSSSSSSSSSSPGFPDSHDKNIRILTAYNADRNVTHLTAVNPLTGNQTTQFLFGTTLDDSDIASTLLKRAEIYPDSEDEDDRTTFKYNRQGQMREKKNQNGTVRVFDFDKLGRDLHDRVVTLGTGVAGGVRRISREYEVRGMLAKLTSYDGETVGSGTIVNQVQFGYNAFGQLKVDYQAHSGAVNTSATPKVQYGYADGSDNTIRPTTLTYPNGRKLTYGYGATDGAGDALSRVAALIDDDTNSTHLADYLYLGAGSFVVIDYTEPQIKYTLIGTAGGNDPDTGDIYRGLDRFDRIKDSYWHNYNTSADIDRIKYGYDRNGNRLWRENTVAASLTKNLDELYGYDQIDRLQDMDRGDLSANKDSVSSLNFAQGWSLDATGNWRRFREDDDGAGWDLDQTRSASKVNEITDITESVGPSWVTPAYDKAGNMTTIPKPADPTVALTGIYDAWNRLVKIKEGDDTLAEYQYDGAMRRTIKKTYSGGALNETRHFYFTEPAMWQVIEEDVDGSSDPERQFVWGQRYIDDIVLRDRDTTGDGTLDERLYGMQDANWNVTGIVDTAGAVQERYAYSAYGEPVFMNASFGATAASSYAWERLFAGYVWDDEVEWYAVRHRVYAVGLGWVQRDPSGAITTINLYAYASSHPIRFIDPSGLAWIDCDLFSGCSGKSIACICFIISSIDTFANKIPTGIMSILLNLADCLCDITDIFSGYCGKCGAVRRGVGTGVILASTILSCLADMLQVFAQIQEIAEKANPLVKTPLSAEDVIGIPDDAMRIFEAVLLLINEGALPVTGAPAGIQACGEFVTHLAVGDLVQWWQQECPP